MIKANLCTISCTAKTNVILKIYLKSHESGLYNSVQDAAQHQNSDHYFEESRDQTSH